VGDPIDEGSQSVRLDPVIDEATLTTFGHEASSAKRSQVLGDGRLGDVEACREVLHRGLSAGETFKDAPAAWIRQSAEDGVFVLHEAVRHSNGGALVHALRRENLTRRPPTGVANSLSLVGAKS
jgi:hypothetical protein